MNIHLSADIRVVEINPGLPCLWPAAAAYDFCNRREVQPGRYSAFIPDSFFSALTKFNYEFLV